MNDPLGPFAERPMASVVDLPLAAPDAGPVFPDPLSVVQAPPPVRPDPTFASSAPSPFGSLPAPTPPVPVARPMVAHPGAPRDWRRPLPVRVPAAGRGPRVPPPSRPPVRTGSTAGFVIAVAVTVFVILAFCASIATSM